MAVEKNSKICFFRRKAPSLWNVAVGSEQGGGMPRTTFTSPPTLPQMVVHTLHLVELHLLCLSDGSKYSPTSTFSASIRGTPHFLAGKVPLHLLCLGWWYILSTESNSTDPASDRSAYSPPTLPHSPPTLPWMVVHTPPILHLN